MKWISLHWLTQICQLPSEPSTNFPQHSQFLTHYYFSTLSYLKSNTEENVFRCSENQSINIHFFLPRTAFRLLEKLLLSLGVRLSSVLQNFGRQVDILMTPIFFCYSVWLGNFGLSGHRSNVFGSKKKEAKTRRKNLQLWSWDVPSSLCVCMYTDKLYILSKSQDKSQVSHKTKNKVVLWLT
jgi:hypothetical protein